MRLGIKELEILCKNAATAAIEAGEYIQSQLYKHYNKALKKSGSSLASQVVTEVDLKAQEIILNHLQSTIQQYDLGLLAEETSDNKTRFLKNYFWCIDPLDGTLAFTEGRTGYAISISLISNLGDPVIGVVYVPDLQECYTSIKGAGVWLNKSPFFLKDTVVNNTLHVYMDGSLQSETYFEAVTNKLNQWSANHNSSQIQYHADFGAVRSALAVMNSGLGCYFKFPKKQKGGGSIWDFASTRLFFEELELFVSNAKGNKLSLNNSDTTFMNRSGTIYTTNATLLDFIITIAEDVSEQGK